MYTTYGLILMTGLLALLFSFWRSTWIDRQEPGSDKMQEIGNAIREGAMAFIKAEYRVMAVFVIAVAVLLYFFNEARGDLLGLVGLSFVVGALCSGLAGFIGLRVATKANHRTTHAAATSLNSALEIAFAGGSVMGLSVVGLGVLGLTILFAVYQPVYSGLPQT
ncbi:MAG: sodium/proton-translocating pyrophosphatase, partial [Candidatus Marinimicrobia bacterium]|nr:sodium/proton-translocating pyrophosphatase [Candidatus Neomarinimicrobiota bacterium]